MNQLLKTVLVSLFALGFTFTFTGCKKYEEGPGLSLRSKKSRLVNEWKLDKLISSSSSSTPEMTMDIKRDGTVTITYSSSSSERKWDLSSSKESLTITGTTSGTTYDIIKLKSKELWLREGNDEYQFVKK